MIATDTITRLITSARVQKLPLSTADKIGEWDLDRWYQLVRQDRRLFNLENHIGAHVPRLDSPHFFRFWLRCKELLRRIFETNRKIDTQANWELCVAYLRATAKEAHSR